MARGLKAAGVPVTIAFTFTAANDQNKLLGRQNGYSSKVSLQDARLPKVQGDFGAAEGGPDSTDGGGAIEFYDTASGAEQRCDYLKGFTGLLGDGYDYQAGGACLRLSSDVLPAQAKQYQAALIKVTG